MSLTVYVSKTLRRVALGFEWCFVCFLENHPLCVSLTYTGFVIVLPNVILLLKFSLLTALLVLKYPNTTQIFGFIFSDMTSLSTSQSLPGLLVDLRYKMFLLAHCYSFRKKLNHWAKHSTCVHVALPWYFRLMPNCAQITFNIVVYKLNINWRPDQSIVMLLFKC